MTQESSEAVHEPESTFKFVVETFGRRPAHEEQIQIIHKYSWMQWKGKVQFKNPKHTFWAIEDYGVGDGSPETVTRPIQRVFFGREVTETARHLKDKYTLKKRKYLGTTSMESEVSFFSANMGLVCFTHRATYFSDAIDQVKPGSLVIDPFVGTGSLLVSAAHFGAWVVGADLDMRVLKGLGKTTNVRDNFLQYGLEHQLGDLIRFDSSKHSVFRHKPIFDAIICDRTMLIT